MAKFHEQLDAELQAFIARQHVFFVASATTAGRINLSPKGLDTFRVIDARTVMYLDLTGSGNETAAHLRADGRLTLMFCSFDTQPLILRLYGRGQVVARNHPDWPGLARAFPPLAGARQIIRLHIESLQTSCGFGVPLLSTVSERDTLVRWAEKKGAEGLRQYRTERNATSIDGLSTGIVADDRTDLD